VGVGDTATGEIHAVLWQHGTITDLGTLSEGDVSKASGINNRGQVVGASGPEPEDFLGRATLWTLK
jgi:probable HAF family extracellular repeat protein